MQLEFKPDFESVCDRWKRFWGGQTSRPMLYAVEPKPGVAPVSKPRPYDCADGDLDTLIDQTLAWATTHDFLGDAIPFFMITLAPDHFAALLGAEIKTSQGETNWVEPCLTTLEDVEITFRRDSRWWRRTVECVEKFRERCDDKLIITATHLQGGLDCLAAMYGTQNLLMDMAIAPDAVHRALDQIDQAVHDVRLALADLFEVSTWGSINRFGMYCQGIIDVPECDVSCMISTDMFDEFQLPHLAREIATTDASIYHLDGLDAIKHLESVCSIDQLDMIQWMPGEGHYDDDHRQLNARIDAMGKGQIFQSYYKLAAPDIKRIWDTSASPKLFFQVDGQTCRSLLRDYESGCAFN